MSKWTVEVYWSTEVEADDEGDALMEADGRFNFYGEARAREVEESDE